MPYRIAFPTSHRAPSSSTPVIAVTRLAVAILAVDMAQAQTQSSAEPVPLTSGILEMTLDEFETQEQALEVRVPWLPESLWFVSSSTVAGRLNLEGITHGRIWTVTELRDLLESGEVALKTIQRLVWIKQELNVGFLRIGHVPASDSCYSAPKSIPTAGESPWPSEITGRGQQILGSFTPCELCEQGTWSRYGGTPLCRRHAVAEAIWSKRADE